MSSVIEKLESLGSKVLEQIETKPIRTIVLSLLVIWLVGKVIKSLR